MDRISSDISLKNVSKVLIDWYMKNHRDLPWRKTNDPYLIWIAEVILQQTRVAQGIDYYNRFTSLFPDIQTLASAPPDDVMKVWQGLGYYSRARNLHEAAGYVVNNLDGKIPSTCAGLIKLKGIGSYIAAAIASFAFNERIPVIDANVIRFIARLAGIYSTDRKNFTTIARNMMAMSEPCLFNQAIMEFGALQCIPGLPRCSDCPFSEKCYAYNHEKTDNLPLKKKRPVPGKRYFHYLVIRKPDGLVMKKRDKSDIWRGLYDFPLVETTRPVSIKKLQDDPAWKDICDHQKPFIIESTGVIRHVLTHQIIHAKFYLIDDHKDQIHLKNGYFKTSFKKAVSLPVPRLIENFIKKRAWWKHQI